MQGRVVMRYTCNIHAQIALALLSFLTMVTYKASDCSYGCVEQQSGLGF